MNTSATRSMLAALLLTVLQIATAHTQTTPPPASDQPQQQFLKAEELDKLVAPIALYPDTLLAEVLMASTYPLEILQADRWATANKALKADQLKAVVDKQSWDESVKALRVTSFNPDQTWKKVDELNKATRRSLGANHCRGPIHVSQQPEKDIEMKTRIFRTLMSGTMLGLVALASLSTASQAETGSVRVVFAKAGFIVGVGSGRGILSFRGRNYPFRVSGMSLGATIGGSTNKMLGQALNMHAPGDIAGSYSTIGAGGALAAGAGGVQLQNAKGVVLQLHGVKAGLELSASVGGVTITME